MKFRIIFAIDLIFWSCVITNMEFFLCVHYHTLFHYMNVMTSSAGPIIYPASNKCLAKLDLLFTHYKSRKCSVYLIEQKLAVCPIYFMLQSGQVIREMTYLYNLLMFIQCLRFSNFYMVSVYRKRSERFGEHKISCPYPFSNSGQ